MDDGTDLTVDISIVMPCLNEARSLSHCIANATQALSQIAARHSLSGEIIIADNGSTDDSVALATSLGARVVSVAEKGYGAALIGGFHGARGRFLIMGDADGSYDFTESIAMIERLLDGAELCLGSRFRGGIKPGAMPWKNRYIGNPVLTGVLNLFFQADVSDAHCGLRALTKAAFLRLRLSGNGMEFASEMLIKAKLSGLRIDEVPVTLSPDLRGRPPHLRPWRDGWRHLRYLLMLSPRWLFGVPGILAIICGLGLMAFAFLEYLYPGTVPQIGSYWTLFASALLAIGHLSLMLALAAHLYGILAGYRKHDSLTRLIVGLSNLEIMLLLGAALLVVGLVVLAGVYLSWVERGYQSSPTIFMPILGTLLLSLGMQNIMGGFLLAIIAGNSANYFGSAPSTVHQNDGRS